MFHVKFSHFSFFSDHTTESDYVKVYASRKGEDPNTGNRPGEGGGCYSGVGKGRGKQVLNLENRPNWCMKSGTIIHEFIHAWGFHHEHTRPDRG